ncbi:MAG: hypothetical protein H7Y04_02420 [Verrucomicrobia bacterium]|nr:hypothetical protein [Cytophagales bacterium]
MNQETSQSDKLTKFKNLFLMANADGTLDDKEKDYLQTYIQEAGLTPAECFGIISNWRNLELSMPADPQATHLKELITMMLADNEIGKEEYKNCVAYAQQLGMRKEDLDDLVKNYQQERYEQAQIIENNLTIYQSVCKRLLKSHSGQKEIAKAMKNVVVEQKWLYVFDTDADLNLAFYQFMWLANVRGTGLNYRLSAANQAHREMILQGKDTFESWSETLQDSEKVYGNSPLNLENKSLDDLQQELALHFK